MLLAFLPLILPQMSEYTVNAKITVLEIIYFAVIL